MRWFAGIALALLLYLVGVLAACAQGSSRLYMPVKRGHVAVKDHVGEGCVRVEEGEFFDMARVASEFACRIRQDVRSGYGKGRVTVSVRRDGVRMLRVHYRLYPRKASAVGGIELPDSNVTGGEFLLTLETLLRRVVGVRLEESVEGGGPLREGTVSSDYSNAFLLQPTNHHWTWTFENSVDDLTTYPDGEQRVACSAQIALPQAELRRIVYYNMLRIVNAAPRKRVIDFAVGWPLQPPMAVKCPKRSA